LWYKRFESYIPSLFSSENEIFPGPVVGTPIFFSSNTCFTLLFLVFLYIVNL
jgi:hypothetical protein